MLGLKPTDLPLEILRLGYALKPITVETIRAASPHADEDPIAKDSVATALGMRLRPLRHDYIQPVLALFGCTAAGLPKPGIVHELFIHTRRSGPDSEVGPIVARWLRLHFSLSDTVYVLPVSSGTADWSQASWVFHSLVTQKICVVTANSTKFHREHGRHALMSVHPFEWLKSIPGQFEFLTSSTTKSKTCWISIVQIEEIEPKLSRRVRDCITGLSADDETQSQVKTTALIPLLEKIHAYVVSSNKTRKKSSTKQSSTTSEPSVCEWLSLQSTNLFESRLIQIFNASGAFANTGVEHEMMASLTPELAALNKLSSKEAVSFFKTVEKDAASSDEVTEALTAVLKQALAKL